MIYDYRLDECIQNVLVEDYDFMVEDILDEFERCRRYDSIAVYAPKDVLSEIMNQLIEIDDDFCISEDSIKLEYASKKCELILFISYDGKLSLCCARNNDGSLLWSDASLTYVHDSYSTKDLEHLAKGETSILVFGLDECDEDDSIEVTFEKDGYHVHINFTDADKEELAKFIKKFLD